MSEFGLGNFHIHYETVDGQKVRKAYRSWSDADKARGFLEALGICPEIDMHTKKKEWGDTPEGEENG